MSPRLLATCLLLALAGCVESEESHGEQVQAIDQTNGVSFNGISLNGISLNGISLNGISLNGISLNGISLNGVSLDGTSLSSASSAPGEPSSEETASVVGSQWAGLLSNGDTLALRIDDTSSGAEANEDVVFYAISYETATGWQPLCGVDAYGEPILAVAVPGTWNTNIGFGGGAYTPSDTRFTFACRGKTIAKCIELGYKPWRNRTKQMQSCVRLLRADYCGDGRPFTVDGTLLNLYDNLGVQTDTEAWSIEAEWTPNGARCLSTASEPRYTLLGQVPWCVSTNRTSRTTTCGKGFGYGAYLIDELHGW